MPTSATAPPWASCSRPTTMCCSATASAANARTRSRSTRTPSRKRCKSPATTCRTSTRPTAGSAPTTRSMATFTSSPTAARWSSDFTKLAPASVRSPPPPISRNAARRCRLRARTRFSSSRPPRFCRTSPARTTASNSIGGCDPSAKCGRSNWPVSRPPQKANRRTPSTT